MCGFSHENAGGHRVGKVMIFSLGVNALAVIPRRVVTEADVNVSNHEFYYRLIFWGSRKLFCTENE